MQRLLCEKALLKTGSPFENKSLERYKRIKYGNGGLISVNYTVYLHVNTRKLTEDSSTRYSIPDKRRETEAIKFHEKRTQYLRNTTQVVHK